MAPRAGSVLALLLTIALAVTSTTFVFLALRSKSWTRQNYYGGDPRDWTKPKIWVTRSPFYKCGAIEQDTSTNTTTYDVPDCQFYKSYGAGKTSCEVVIGDVLTGSDVKECQAVHYCGNLQIAACALIGTGMILTLLLAVVTILSGSRSSPSSAGPVTTEGADGAKEKRHGRGSFRKPTSNASWVTTLLFFCMYAGAVVQVFAQYFGVLGLVVWATNPAANQGTDVDLQSLSWFVDRGLSIYATVAWTSALATAGVAGVVFRTPKA